MAPVLVSTAAFFALLAASFACSCLHRHMQVTYCQSDFVVQARVKHHINPKNYEHLKYKIAIRRTFKMSPEAYKGLKNRTVYTPSHSGICGLPLEPSKELILLSGYMRNGHPIVAWCSSLFSPWSKLTRRQRKGILKLYGAHCECQAVENRRSNSTKQCKNFGHCEDQYAICMRDSNNNCYWSGDKQYKQCKKNYFKSL